MSDAPAAAEGEGATTFFAEGQGSADVPGQQAQQGNDHTSDKAGADERPEWLFDKYETVEAQAQAYKDLHGKYTQKNDKFREDVAKEYGDEFLQNHFKEAGVPEAADQYTYPENFDVPDGEIDTALREWAKENNVTADAFGNLIENVWGLTQANYETEAKKLGDTPEAVMERIEPLNGWIGATFDEAFNPTIGQIMRTAEGVEFMEALQNAMSENGFAPDAGDNPAPPQLTREGIREKMQDPRYQNDPFYQAQIAEMWQKFAAQQQG